MSNKVLTGTLEQIQNRLDELNGKIERDENGIEKFKVIYHNDKDLVTLIYVAIQEIKKTKKQPTTSKLRAKINELYLSELDVIRVETRNNGQAIYAIVDSQTNKIIKFKGTGLSCSRWLTKFWVEKTNQRLRLQGLIA